MWEQHLSPLHVGGFRNLLWSDILIWQISLNDNLAAQLTPICSTQTFTKRIHKTVCECVSVLEVCICSFMHIINDTQMCVGSDGETVSSPQRHPAEQRAHSIWPALKRWTCLCTLCGMFYGNMFKTFKSLQPTNINSSTGNGVKMLHFHWNQLSDCQ